MNRPAKLLCIVIFCFFIFILTGCINEKISPNEYYVIGALRDSSPVVSSHKTIKVLNITVSQVFDSSNLVYKLTGNKFEEDYYNRYFANVGVMIQKSLTKWLSDSNLFDSVLDSRSLADVDYTLEGHIIDIYGDFSDRTTPSAVVSMQFVLLDGLGRSSGSIKEWKYTQRVDVSNKSPESLIDAYNIAFSKIFTSIEKDLAEAI